MISAAAFLDYLVNLVTLKTVRTSMRMYLFMTLTFRVLILRLSDVYVHTIWPFYADCVIPDRLATQILKDASKRLIFKSHKKIMDIKLNEIDEEEIVENIGESEYSK